MKKLLLGTVLAATLSMAYAEKPSTDSVKALLNQLEAGQLGVQMMSQMMPSLKQMAPNAPDSFWESFMSKVKSDEIVDMLVPVYQQHLSQSDIDALRDFYATDAGKSFIKAQPHIARDSMLIGQQWGQRLARDVLAEYRKQYGK